MSKPIEKIPLTFLLTPEHSCPYLDNTNAKTLFLSPEINIQPKLYSALIEQGFRRSGDQVYRPHCDNCQACISVRIPVNQFALSRSQKRCFKRSSEFRQQVLPASFTPENYHLFEKYINQRHPDGDMFPPSISQFKSFLLNGWIDCNFLSLTHIKNNQLAATAVFDVVENGLSAVYTYFDSDYDSYSLGKMAILKLIALTQQRNLDYLYLGYWIKQSPKMAYKGEYRPIECFVNQNWVQLN